MRLTLQAELYGSGQCVAIEDLEGARHTTDHTVDMVQTALLLVQVIAGALPAAIDPDRYDMGVQVPTHSKASKPGWRAFFKAFREFDWVAWVQEEPLPDDVRDFLLWCLEPEPCNRPQTGAEALQHPFLVVAADKVRSAIAAAASELEQVHTQLQELLCDGPRVDTIVAAVETVMAQGSKAEGETGAGCSHTCTTVPSISPRSIQMACTPAALLLAHRL